MKQSIWSFLYRFFPEHGHHLLPSGNVYDWQKDNLVARGQVCLDGDEQKNLHLGPDNPRLLELRERYAAFDKRATVPLVWTAGHVTKDDLSQFRGSHIYVSQDCGLNYGAMAMALSYYYLRSRDHLGLLDKFTEDHAFATRLFEIDGRMVSRDLLDSVTEILFLDREFALAGRDRFTVLDIGAGYGRLAHRMTQAMPNLDRYLCTDAVPESTFICERYLGFRGADDKAHVVPVDEIEKTLASTPVDLAVNIHSFSECSLEAIGWWSKLLAGNRVPWLLVCPNAKFDGGRFLGVEDGRGFREVIEGNGYELAKVMPKYEDPFVQAYGLDPSYFHLFKLR